MFKRRDRIGFIVCITLVALLIHLTPALAVKGNVADKARSNDLAQVSSAKAALAQAGSLNPVEGIDTSVLAMAQSFVDQVSTGVKVVVKKSNNTQISNRGIITYGAAETSGNVVFQLTRNQATATQSVNVVVSAKIDSAPSNDPDISTDKVEVEKARNILINSGTIIPVEGKDTNLIIMIQTIVDKAANGVTVTITSSTNSQVSADGTVTYGNTNVNGDVVFKLSKGEISETQSVMVAIPAKIQINTDAVDVTAAKNALLNAGVIRPVYGIDANVTDMAQTIVNKVVSGVTVGISAVNNPQVTANGMITYGPAVGTGDVTLSLTKNVVVDSVIITVEVPAYISIDGISCSELGLVRNDLSKARSNTTLLLQAIQGGKKILVDGSYYLGYSDTRLSDTTISFTGSTPDAEFRLPDNCVTFYINNNVDVYVKGTRFTPTGSGPSYLFRFAPTCLSNKVVIENNSFVGNMRCMWFPGSTTVNPAVTPFGIREFYFTGNTVDDTRVMFINVNDMPSDKIVIEGNTINNFDYTFLHSGISNGITYTDEMYAAKKSMVVRNNRVACDDDWWGTTANTIYYCFILFEGFDCLYEGNHVEGLKYFSPSGPGAQLYDSYLSAANLQYTDNTWKNNLSFNTTKANGALLKSKGGPPNIKLNRVYENNSYTIEQSFIEMCSSQLAVLYGEDPAARLTKDLSAGWVDLLHITRPGGTYQIRNNTFDIYDLRTNYQDASIEHMLLEGNTFNCEKIGGTLLEYGALDDRTNYGDNTCIVRNNTVAAQTLSKDYFNIVRTGWNNTNQGTYGTILIANNWMSAPCTYFLYSARAKTANIYGNTVKSVSYKDVTLNSNIDTIICQDNHINE